MVGENPIQPHRHPYYLGDEPRGELGARSSNPGIVVQEIESWPEGVCPLKITETFIIDRANIRAGLPTIARAMVLPRAVLARIEQSETMIEGSDGELRPMTIGEKKLGVISARASIMSGESEQTNNDVIVGDYNRQVDNETDPRFSEALLAIRIAA